VAIYSDEEQLLFTGDVFHHPLQLAKPDLDDIFDLESKQGSHTRIQMLSKTITPDILVSASHFPFPGLGHIIKRDNAWLWRPIEMKT
jgi:glyoxylase-like metal-dependent hydrolase (beta-lactamase superfamily II)